MNEQGFTVFWIVPCSDCQCFILILVWATCFFTIFRFPDAESSEALCAAWTEGKKSAIDVRLRLFSKAITWGGAHMTAISIQGMNRSSGHVGSPSPDRFRKSLRCHMIANLYTTLTRSFSVLLYCIWLLEIKKQQGSAIEITSFW